MTTGSFSTPGKITEADIVFAYRFIANSRVDDASQLGNAHFIANQLPNARAELFRHLLQNADWTSYSSFLPILLDVAVRMRVFSGSTPPTVNLFCIGGARCGTTTLSLMLSQNTNIYLSPMKEINFFSHLSNMAVTAGLPIEVYELFFFGWLGQPVVADFSPVYILYERARAAIKAYNPDAKIIVCLRNPVDRAMSAFFYTNTINKVESSYEFFSSALNHQGETLLVSDPWHSAKALLRQGMYYDDLQSVTSQFSNVLIIDFQELNDLENLNKRVCGFLGVPTGSLSWIQSLGGRINASETVASTDVLKARNCLEEYYALDISLVRSNYGVELATQHK